MTPHDHDSNEELLPPQEETEDIEWRESDSHVLMTGDAAEVYRGEITI